MFLSIYFTPSVAIDNVKKSTYPIGSGNTLYVGGTGKYNYTTIQDALDNASNGDTVFVYDDSSPYYENIVINKTINLIGEDSNTTIINGSGIRDVVYISANWVNLSSFTIQNSGRDCYYNKEDAGISVKSQNNTITGNNISCNYAGIYLGEFSNSNIINSNIISNNQIGIHIFICYYNTITDNNIVWNNETGIFYHSSYNSTITGNNINNNGQGIYLIYSVNNTIEYNNICNNKKYGLYLHNNLNNFFIKNNFIKNSRHVYQTLGDRYDSNFWDNWIGIKIKLSIFQKFPKIMIAWLFFPFLVFDRHPAKEPYEIL